MNQTEPMQERVRPFPEKFKLRDLRDFAIGISFWPLHWGPWFDLTRDDDSFGGRASLTIGPIVLHVDYNAHDGPFGMPIPGLDQS